MANYSLALSAPVRISAKVRFGVGGMLPDPNVAVIGISDFQYKTVTNNVVKFVTEVKRADKYRIDDLWYRDSRVCQAMGALYYSGVPTLLHSPSAYKLLFENRSKS